jgi:hypothetical protein
MEKMREELRQALSKLGPRGRGKAYPKGLMGDLLSYTVARRRQGATVRAIADELGMSWQTLSRWTGGRKAGARFERVEVVTAPASAPRALLVVHGPLGLRIEGLDLDGVVDLVRRVAE